MDKNNNWAQLSADLVFFEKRLLLHGRASQNPFPYIYIERYKSCSVFIIGRIEAFLPSGFYWLEEWNQKKRG
jgi:hypothetical protein